MARMIPARPREGASDAEQTVFRALEAALDDSFTILHQVRWYEPGDDRRRTEAFEADYLVLHPTLGIVDLEVKGGGVRYDPRADCWRTVDREGRTHDLGRSPLDQAMRNAHSLCRVVKRDPRWSGGFLTAGYAAVLPDCRLDDQPLPAGLPRELLLDKGQIADLRPPILALFRRHAETQAAPLGETGVEAVVEAVAPKAIRIDRSDTEVRIRVPLALEFREEAAAIDDVTARVCAVHEGLRATRRAVLSGCAGSGKTFLAVEHARWLAAQGCDVLFLCFNRLLAADLRRRFSDRPRVEATHFHDLCWRWAEAAGMKVVGPEQDPAIDPATFYNETLPQQLLEAIPRTPRRFHALFVDEAQDFQTEWWIPLLGVLEGEAEGMLYVCLDDAQAIDRSLQDLPATDRTFVLEYNLRNTQRIHECVRRFCRRARMTPAFGPPGRDVEVATYSADRELAPLLSRTLHRLQVDGRVPAQDIAVLTYRRLANTPLHEGRAGASRLTPSPDPAPGEVFATTIHAFKGLERPVVILAGLEDSARLTDDLLYVGCSRARNHLIVLCRDEVRARFTDSPDPG